MDTKRLSTRESHPLPPLSLLSQGIDQPKILFLIIMIMQVDAVVVAVVAL